MAGTGNVYVISASNISNTTTRVSIGFDIAFDWGGWNSTGAGWTITCDGQSHSGTSTFNINSGGGNWVWGNIAYGITFDLARGSSARVVNISATINTGVNPATISASTTYTVPAIAGTPPGIPINPTATRNSDSQLTIKWTNNPPSTGGITGTYINEAVNDGGYSQNINTTTSGSQTSFVRTGLTTNSKYVYRLMHYNGYGQSSDYAYTPAVYTTPATPQGATAIKIGNRVGLICDHSNVRYPASFQWQRASNSSFTSGLTTLSGTASSISDTTTLETPYYRVRVLGMTEGLYSGWRTATLTKSPQIFVQIPDGKTIQDIYVYK